MCFSQFHGRKRDLKKIELKENEDKILKLNSPKLSNSKINLERKIRKKNPTLESRIAKFEETYNSEKNKNAVNYFNIFISNNSAKFFIT